MWILIDVTEIKIAIDNLVIECRVIKGDTILCGARECLDLDGLAHETFELEDGIGARFHGTDGISGFREIFIIECIGGSNKWFVRTEYLFRDIVDMVIMRIAVGETG